MARIFYQDDIYGSIVVCVWEYVLRSGYHVLAGKTDSDNDSLSLKIASPDDWWFHVCNMPGSHVLLVTSGDNDVDVESLKQAASIAAYHSKAREGGKTAVSGTLARYVTKPRGSKPGLVHIRKGKIFKVLPAIPKN